jgi:hypothetical protein
MPRRKIPSLLAAVLLAALTANASDFWQTKNWNNWSKDACEKLLTESPWARTWTGTYSVILGRVERPVYGVPTPSSNDLVYTVQIRSALAIREAIVREQQLSQKYDKMNGDQRKAFDSWAGQILNQGSQDPIIVRVDLSKGADLDAFVQPGEILHASLVTDDGAQISATSVHLDQSTKTFDASFPRVIDGVPAIKDGQKYFSIQFQSPQVLVVDGRNIPVQPEEVKTPAQSVQVKFDLSKMLVNGKASY